MAAAACARRTLTSAVASSPRSILRSISSTASPSCARISRRAIRVSRSHAELGCVQSLLPLHSATASALLTSMLSVGPGSWGWLSEGLATPL